MLLPIPRPRVVLAQLGQRPAVFDRHHHYEVRQRVRPIGEQLRRLGAAGRQLMALEQDAQPFRIVAQRMAHAGVVHARGALRGRPSPHDDPAGRNAFERNAVEVALVLKRASGS